MPQETTTDIERVAEVLQQLKQEVYLRQHSVGSAASLGRRGTVGLARPVSLEQVHASMRVNPHLPIAWPTWPKGLWAKVVAVVQKVVRRSLKWYIDPIVEQQNRFNIAVAQTLDLLWWEMSRLQTLPPQEKPSSEPEGQ
jgi:hypothetical protein